MTGEFSSVLIKTNRKILIVKRPGEESWSLPGAIAIVAEGPRAAIIRGLREQFVQPIIKELPALKLLARFDPSTANPRLTSIFWLECGDPFVPRKEQFIDAKWIDLHEAGRYRLPDEVTEALSKLEEREKALLQPTTL